VPGKIIHTRKHKNLGGKKKEQGELKKIYNSTKFKF